MLDKFNVGDRWLCRDGASVVIDTVLRASPYPIRGVITLDDGSTHPSSWTPDGMFYETNDCFHLDLVRKIGNTPCKLPVRVRRALDLGAWRLAAPKFSEGDSWLTRDGKTVVVIDRVDSNSLSTYKVFGHLFMGEVISDVLNYWTLAGEFYVGTDDGKDLIRNVTGQSVSWVLEARPGSPPLYPARRTLDLGWTRVQNPTALDFLSELGYLLIGSSSAEGGRDDAS